MRTIYTPKPTFPLNENGEVKVAQSYNTAKTPLFFNMYKFFANPDGSFLFDTVIDTPFRMVGGEVWYGNPQSVHEEDYISFSIIDKDDIFGAFAAYGIVKGEGELRISKYVEKEYVKKGSMENEYYSKIMLTDMSSRLLPAGLVLRTKYVSHSIEPISVKLRYLYYKG